MTIRYLLVVVTFLACSCGNHTGNGVVILNGNGIETHPILPAADDSQNSSADAIRIFHPRILVAANPVANNADQSQVSSSVDNAPEPVALIRSAPLIAAPPVLTQTNKASVVSLVKKPVLVRPHPAQSGVTKNSITACEHAFCPMIFCPNSLPAIPSQGICCPRCNFNSKCNSSACPKYKCVGDIAPANVSAGECCDHCAPVTTKPTHQTKSHKVPRVTKKVERSSSEDNSMSSDVSEGPSSSSSSSAEEYAKKRSECQIRPKHKKHHKSCLLGRLTRPLGHRLRHPRPFQRSCDCEQKK